MTSAYSLQSPASSLIYAYTRKQALADGFQIDVTTTAAEAGIRFPFYITRGVWEKYVTVPAGGRAQAPAQDTTIRDSEQPSWGTHLVAGLGSPPGRLWDLVWMTRFAIIRSNGRAGSPQPAASRLPVALYVRNDNERSRLVKLIATAGAVDIDDPRPAITLMLPEED